MDRVKVVIKCKDVETGEKDVIVKTGCFYNNPPSILTAYKEGVYDKYSLVLRDKSYSMPKHSFRALNRSTATGMLDKRDASGALLKRVTFSVKILAVAN